MSSAAPSSPHGWRLPAALASVYLIWGSTYLAMRFALAGFTPMMMVGVRYTIAGLLLVGFLLARGAPMPTAGQWLRALPIGILMFVGGNGFVALGEVDIGSGLAAVIIATTPLWMAALSAATGERPSWREMVGLALGMAGVVVLSLEGELRGNPLSAFFLFCAPLSWVIGSVLTRRLALPAGAMAAGVEMLLGGLAAFVVAFVLGDPLPLAPTAGAVAAMVYLIVLGSLVGFVAYAWLLTNTRPAIATSYAFVNPVIAVVLGAALGAERFGWQTAAAAPLIITAVALVVLSRDRR